jgi:type I restriction enzyme S subunit
MRDGWIETSLEEVAEVIMGQSPDGKSYNQSGEGLPFMQGSAEFGEHHPTPEKWCSDPKKIAEPGDLLLSVRAPVGDTNFANQRIAVGRGLSVIRANSKSLTEFIRFVIQLNVTEMIASSGSGMFASITGKNLKEFKVLLPPLPEQKRIVDLISSIDSYIEALQLQLVSAKKSRNAVLHELLTAGGDNWVETTLGEVAHLNPEQARDFDSDRLIKYIDLSTVTFDTGISTEIEQLPFNEAPGRARRIIREKDVIVSTVRPYLKGFAFVGKEFNGQIASTGFCVIRAKSESILSELIWALVGSDDFVDFLIRRSTGSNYPAVRPNDISDFAFMLPPLHDQETVSKLITTFDDTIRASAVLIDSAQNLRSGLLSDLLSGEHEIPTSYDKVIGAA